MQGDATRRQGEDVPVSVSHKSYLVDNNQQLDVPALEQRMALLLAEKPSLPAAGQPLPSMQPVAPPSVFRQMLARLRSSYLVGQWLPRHPRLYRLMRAVYRWSKRVLRRE
jgi:hypothetical protein